MQGSDFASLVSRPSLLSLPDRVLLPFAFHIDPLLADLAMLAAQNWTSHFVPAHFDGDWTILPLRAPSGATHPIMQITSNPSTTAWDDTAYLKSAKGIGALLASLPCRMGTVRLMRLAPGSVIHEHRDDDLNAAWGMARLHVPLATNDAVDFRLNGHSVKMAVGECWYLRLSDPHSVTNNGGTGRVHLVIDAFVDDWLEQQLLTGAAQPSSR
jgi:Aspartyl/Asparaginyl beta-hydroxylase